MDSNFFALISRMRYIERWSLMRNSIHENIQEHSHMVAVIAHALGVIRRDVFGIPCDADACATVALYHDASEILTGDLPTPIKYHDDEIMSAYRRVEQIASEKLLTMLPVELRGAFEPVLTGDVVKQLRPIVKAADKISAYIKCMEERKMGNREFAEAETSTLSAIRRIDLPEVQDFMDDFVPGFGMSLDEISRD